MRLAILDSFPNDKRLGFFVVVFVGLFIIMNIIVNYVFNISGYPASFMESQLSFSGNVIRSHFSMMTGAQIRLYFYAQLVDFGFIFVYASLIFLLGIYLGRRFPEKSIFRTSAYIIALAGIIAGCCDATENGFIILMANNPLYFPDIYALSHSIFAFIKFLLLGTSIIWILFLAVTYLIKKNLRTH